MITCSVCSSVEVKQKVQIIIQPGKTKMEFRCSKHGIPYPAAFFYQDNWNTQPQFCLHPEKCIGRSSCPREHACCD